MISLVRFIRWQRRIKLQCLRPHFRKARAVLRCVPVAPLWGFTAAVCLMAPLQAEAVEALGRLLFSPLQRQQLDAGFTSAAQQQLARGEVSVASAARAALPGTMSAREGLRIDGYSMQPSGLSLWINGQEFGPGQRGPLGVHIVGLQSGSQVLLRSRKRLVRLGVGDILYLGSGRVEGLAVSRAVMRAGE